MIGNNKHPEKKIILLLFNKYYHEPGTIPQSFKGTLKRRKPYFYHYLSRTSNTRTPGKGDH